MTLPTHAPHRDRRRRHRRLLHRLPPEPRWAAADVLLLEQGKLTSGTTWHAAGLVGQMRPNRNMTRHEQIRHRAVQPKLEAETGLATGWKQCGSVNVAAHARAHAGAAQAGRAGAQLRRRGAM